MVNGKKDRDLLADYFDNFNEQVDQFLDPYASNDYELEGSHIHINSKLNWFEDNEKANVPNSASDLESESESDEDETAESDEDEHYETADEYQEEIPRIRGDSVGQLGSFWSVSEKIMFFHCLSRYSIHGLDDWRDRLPSKSKLEILVYYNVLKKNLRDVKRQGTNFSRILSREELPIAYEMDEFYVSLEERMSERVRIETDKPVADPEAEETGLLSIRNWNRRWTPIYSRTRVEELTPSCFYALPFSQDAIDYLTKRCIEYTRRLVTSAIVADLDKVAIPKSMIQGQDTEITADDQTLIFSNPKKFFPRVLTRESILNAVYLLRQEGFDSPTLADTILRSVKKFDLECRDDGRLFRTRSVTMSLVPTLVESASRSQMPISTAESAMDTDTDRELDLALAHKLYRLNGGKPLHKKRRIEEPQDHFIQDDELDRMDNPLELELCDWETQLLEAADTRASRLQQHRLMAYYTGDTTPLSIEPINNLKCPVSMIPSRMVKRYLHSNT